MPYVKPVSNYERINFLASAKFQAFTDLVSNVGVSAGEDGRKIVKAGTILPANDGTAKGILLNDVDVTYGPQPGSLVEEAYILEDRLPAVPTAEAKTALKEIKFK
ncbi:hypothetical protein [Paenibacillus vini]|uniref:Head decoration protein n=1 Tax=Paenibacillus vini TaxID=1476024 RepID=A0ABQ4MIZ6_9BACL|nr:hypothetical protein [Paenibacillus vini]GIP55951.1 hypothetical protein J42TS3_49860 [Paenibacillus vini]